MYRILLVDDEVVEREVIRFLLNKYEFPFVVFEASNGKEALAMLKKKKFDLLFTDIKMPFMDGVELSRQARELYPDLNIVFFSGYDDFEYARQALSLRIFNYILKPVNPDEFQETMQNVLQLIHLKEEQDREEKATSSFLRSYMILKLINGMQPEQLKSLNAKVDLSFADAYHRLFLIQLEGEVFSFEMEETDCVFQNELQQYLPEDCDWINLNPSQNLLLFYGRKHHLKWYQNAAEELVSNIQKLCNVNCNIVISNVFSGSGEICKAYTDAEQNLLDCFFFKNKSTFCAEENQTMETTSESEDDAMLLKQLEKDIRFKDSVSLKKHMALLLNSYQKSQRYSHLYTRYLCTNLLKLLLEHLPSDTLKTFDEYATVIQRCNNFSEIADLIRQLTDELAAELDANLELGSHPILLAKQYIDNHYSENLSLDILAENIYLSPRYLSALFIEKEGIGINKYIKAVRMKKAQELLVNTNLKISDVCSKVGYQNLSYFCKSFQKDFGVTPEKFRSASFIK